ncbi:hypothetical protein EJB05_24725, partial [Eragrostis curvula]
CAIWRSGNEKQGDKKQKENSRKTDGKENEKTTARLETSNHHLQHERSHHLQTPAVSSPPLATRGPSPWKPASRRSPAPPAVLLCTDIPHRLPSGEICAHFRFPGVDLANTSCPSARWVGGGFVEMEDVVDDVIGATRAAAAVENGVNGKPGSPDGVTPHAEEEHEERANGDNSGESEVINPPEEAGGEATSPPEGRKLRLSKRDQDPKVVKSKSPRSGDEGQTRRRAPNSSLPNGDAGVGSNKTEKNEARPPPKDKDASLSDDSKEKRKTQKPLGQHSSVKRDEAESNCESSKPRKTGSTPSYGFTFKCDERSEKRREFYSKLEEKIHAREIEISNMQAKSKETEEAELKMLRKSLKFKATPMPSFYKEPPPAKVELKKTPPTRARSPKLGRPKSKSTQEVEENTTTNQPLRLSLDEKIPQNGVKQSTPSSSVKKPQRKSLPKLPSEETGPLDTAASTKVKAIDAQGNESLTEESHGTEVNTDFVQGPIRAEVTPDEQELSGHIVA